MDQNLSDLLLRKRGEPALGPTIDWDDHRDKYLAAIRDLYQQIETMLAEPIRQQTVALQRRRKELTETYIGSYSADDLILVIGGEQVRFSPRGRNIAGADGRVDVIGERGIATLVLQAGSGWGFVQSRQPVLRIEPFSESTLAEVLKLVMRE